jgi:hypothetical protein
MEVLHLRPQIPILQEFRRLDAPIPQRRLRPFVLQKLAPGALREAHLGLLFEVKVVILGIQRLGQVRHVSLRVQRLPRPRADAALAALEREEQRVEARRQLVGVVACNEPGLVVQVGALIGIRLLG